MPRLVAAVVPASTSISSLTSSSFSSPFVRGSPLLPVVVVRSSGSVSSSSFGCSRRSRRLLLLSVVATVCARPRRQHPIRTSAVVLPLIATAVVTSVVVRSGAVTSVVVGVTLPSASVVWFVAMSLLVVWAVESPASIVVRLSRLLPACLNVRPASVVIPSFAASRSVVGPIDN